MKYNNRQGKQSPITDGIQNIIGIADYRNNDPLDDLLNGLNDGGDGQGGGGTGKGGNTDGDGGKGTGQGQQGAGDGQGGGNQGGADGNGGDGGNGGAGSGNNDTPTLVTVDNIEYTLDKDGNALNKEGVVIYTKEQLDAFNPEDGNGGNGAGGNGDDELPLVDEVINTLGYQILDESGKPKTYEDNIPGLVAYIKDVVPKLVTEGANQFLAQNAKVKKYYEHLATGGTDEQFFNVIKQTWKNVQFDDKNVVQHKDIIKHYLMKSGMDAEDAALNAESIGNTEKGATVAKKYFDLLVTKETEEADAITQRYNDAVKKQEEDRRNYLKAVDEIVLKKGQLHNFIIPEADRTKFIEYLFKANKDGKTQDQIDQENDPLEVELQLAYLRYKNFDIASLVKRSIKSEQTTGLRKRLSDNSGGNRMKSGANTRQSGGGGSANVDVSLENLY